MLAGGFASPARADVVVRAGTASISNDLDAGTWTIRANGAALTLSLSPALDFEVVRLVSPSGVPWTTATASDASVKVGGQSLPLGSRAAGFVYKSVATSVQGRTVRLDATFESVSARIRVTRHYTATSGSPTFEAWTTFAPLSGSATISDPVALRLSLSPGNLHWLNGLQDDAPDQPRDTAFTMQQRELDRGERLSLGAEGRSSEQYVPWFSVDGDQDEFYAGLMWSGAWSLTLARSAAGLQVTLGLAPMTTTLTGPIEGPHVFFGIARGGLPQASAALRSFVLEGVRGGRPLTPLVTYNTWFAYGVDIDEATLRGEIDAAADLGAELFVIDAGWYVGAGRGGVSDFTSGLGSWQIDAAKFPNGLRALTDYAHARGLRLGLWVEPERVAQSTINQRGLAEEAWLAKESGKYGSTQAAQVCFASAAARQWVLSQLFRLLDAVQPDYLKWDNNFWLNCDRSGHGHGTTDGNFAHVHGLYDVLEAVRARYPELLLENVSGGGNRLDFGMLRYSDVGWMDDRTVPSAHVRHIAQGLGVVFPPAYLLSFVMEAENESLHGASDVPLYFRSRMIGALGLCFRTGEFGDEDIEAMTREILLYKTLRSTLVTASGAMLSPQAADSNGPSWDVFQATAFGRPVLISAVQVDSAADEITVRPIGLVPWARYEVRSVDAGVLGVASGRELMEDGISVLESPNSAAHVLLLTFIPR